MRGRNLLIFLPLIICAIVYAAPPTGDFLNTNVFYAFLPSLATAAIPLAAPMQVRFIAIQSELRYEAWAAYHPTAKGKYLGTSLKRPVSEHTVYNKNVAIAYATARVSCDLAPHLCTQFKGVLTSVGLNAEDQNRNPSSPIGIGNLVADAVIANRHRDGCNQLGDEGGIQYPKVNFSDYTGYTPVNDINHIHDPDSWQPLIRTDPKMRPVAQLYLMPQMGLMKTLVVNLTAASVAKQKDRYDEKRGKYIKKVKEVMKAQRELTTYQKLVSEYFDDKIRSFNGLGDYFVERMSNYHVDYHTVFNFVVNNVIFEGMGAVWKLKTDYDAVRPETAVHFLYPERQVIAWGGPRKGNVLMKGKEWRSYLPTDSFPDYPSGTSCLCAAWTSAAKLLTGLNTFSFNVSYPAGSSVIEPGFTPSTNTVLQFTSFEQIAEECMMSRVWAGVHFMQAVKEARKLCAPYGVQFYNKTMSMIQGN